jgi:hypothetical protein
MNLRAHGPKLLDQEAPARRRLERRLDPPALEATPEASERLTVRRADAAAPHLARLAVEQVVADLRSMLIKSHYDRHWGPP